MPQLFVENRATLAIQAAWRGELEAARHLLYASSGPLLNWRYRSRSSLSNRTGPVST